MTFNVAADAYDRFMGQYSSQLSSQLADLAGIEAGQRAIDVGCGPGALTAEVVRRLGANAVAAVDPSEQFVEAIRTRHPGVDVQLASAEDLPFGDDEFDAALAQLVVHFMADPVAGVGEMARVTRPGGAVVACTWDFGAGMEMLRIYWESARAIDPEAQSEPVFGTRQELDELWRATGLEHTEVEPLEVTRSYEDFHELWNTFLLGAGPSGQFLLSRDHETQEAIRREYSRRLGEPKGRFELRARAWAARGRVPG
jgi:ubiquinone/menaquinone biosynthesis C-methylase UbiE